MIRLYQETEREFVNNGLGALSDATSCIVTEERNGAFELEMIYPITGIHYDEIKNNRILMAKPNPIDQEQPFRIYQISKPMNGLVTVNAAHISYDLSGIILSPFSASSVTEALSKIDDNSSTENPFTFWTDKSTVANFTVSVPSSIRSIMGGSSGSLLDVYGGEYDYDRFIVRLYNQRGANSGVTIRYGKNLTDIKQEENIQNVYTGVYPYWSGSENTLVTLPEKTINAPGTYFVTRILALDLSGEFDEPPTEEQLRQRAEKYIESNKIGVPKVSISVSFVPLEQTEEYKDKALLERVSLCDTVTVKFPALGVDAKAEVVKTEYDVLKGKYQSIELGDARTNIADTIAQQQQSINNTPTQIRTAVENGTNWIVNGKGYMVAVKDESGNWKELCSLDVPDIQQATKVWRWNNGGFGFSDKGYNGPYKIAITQDGAIVADFITTGILTANLIKSGVLESLDGSCSINLETGGCELTGTFKAKDGQLDNAWLVLSSSGFFIEHQNKYLGGFHLSTDSSAQEVSTSVSSGSFDLSALSTGAIPGSFFITDGKSKLITDLMECSDIDCYGSLKILNKDVAWTNITVEGQSIPVLTYN